MPFSMWPSGRITVCRTGSRCGLPCASPSSSMAGMYSTAKCWRASPTWGSG